MFCLVRKSSLKVSVIFLLVFIFVAPTYAAVSAIIFDCDGVLVDTEYLKFEAWRDALSKRGITFTLKDYLPLVGHSSEKIASEIEKEKNIQFDKPLLIQEKNNFYKVRQAGGVPPIPNAVTFLKHLLANKTQYGIKIGLASSAPHREINRNLESIGVNPKDFDAIASGDDDLKHIVDPTGTNKPKPYIYQEIAMSMKVNPKDCLVFEDTNAGVEAAAAAGMQVVAVPNQYTKNQDFKKSIEIISFELFTIQKLQSQFLNKP